MAMQSPEIGQHATALVDGLHTDISPSVPGVVCNLRPWLDWAVTQLNDSLAADGVACGALLAALDAVLHTGPGEPAGGPAAGELSLELTPDQKMSAVVIAVQSHDRLMQQITHVAEALRRLEEHLAVPTHVESCEAWVRLCQIQIRAFSMAEERALFAGIVGSHGAHEALQSRSPTQSDAVDLFGEPFDTEGHAQ